MASASHTLEVGGNALFQNSANSTTAFQIQNAAGTSNLFVADTTNGRIGIGTASPVSFAKLTVVGDIYSSGGSLDLDDGTYVAWGDSSTHISGDSGSDILSFVTNGSTVATLGSNGAALFKNSADSTTAFQVQKSDSTPVLVVDTTNKKVGIGVAPGSSALTVQDGNNAEISLNTSTNLSTDSADISVLNRAQFGYSNGNVIINDNGTGKNFQMTLNGNVVQSISSAGAVVFNSGVTGGTLTADIAGTTTAHGVCHSGASGAAANVQFVACSGTAGADYAELYPSQPDVSAGDVIMTTSTYATSKDGKYQVPVVAKTSGAYEPAQIGVVSDIDPNSDESNLTGHNVNNSDHPMPVALNGRVLTKVNTENGDIVAGDYITASSTPGVGMKATSAGEVIGRAMQSYSGSGVGQVLVFVNPFYYSGPTATDSIQNGGDATLSSLNVTGTADFADLNVSGTATINNLTVTTLSASTANIGTLTVTGSAHFADDITIDGHIITAGGQPTAQAQTAIGTGASVAVDGTDTTGTITITTGSAPTAGTWPRSCSLRPTAPRRTSS